MLSLLQSIKKGKSFFLSWTLTSFTGGPPASDPGLRADRKMVGRGRQTDGPDVLVEGDVSIQLHQSNVVVVGDKVVVLVDDDFLHLPLYRPLVALALHMQTEKDLPLVGLGVPGTAHSSQNSETQKRLMGQLGCSANRARLAQKKLISDEEKLNLENQRLDQGCQTPIPRGPKNKNGTKSRPTLIFIGNNLLLCGFYWQLPSNKVEYFCHQPMWGLDPTS